MSLVLEPAWNETEAVEALFREYTDMLLRESPAVAEHLKRQNFNAELADLKHKYGPPNGRLYLARWDGAAAGCGALRRLDKERCELKRLYVRPEFRGRGIARSLMDRLTADAGELGYRRTLLDTLPFLTSAVALYRGLGFREIPCYSGTPLPETLYMELDL